MDHWTIWLVVVCNVIGVGFGIAIGYPMGYRTAKDEE